MGGGVRSVRSMISEVPLRTAVVKLSAGRWVGLAEALMWSRVREPLLPPVGWSRCWLARVRPRAQSQEADLDGVFVREGEPVLAFWRRHEDAPRLIAALCPLLLPDCLAAYLLLLDLLFAGALCSAALGDRGTCDDNIHCRLYKPLLLVGWQRGLLATEFDCAPATHHTPPLCAPAIPAPRPPPPALAARPSVRRVNLFVWRIVLFTRMMQGIRVTMESRTAHNEMLGNAPGII